MMEIQKRQQINKLDNKVIDDKEIADLLKNWFLNNSFLL